MSEFSYEIIKNLLVLSGASKGWKKELNVVKWGENQPKFDIRSWGDNHKIMGKGITLSPKELVKVIHTIANNMSELSTNRKGLVIGDSKYNCEVFVECGVISTNKKGWSKEVNIVRWAGGNLCFDLRSWGPQKNRIGKGITLDEKEAKALVSYMASGINDPKKCDKDNDELTNQALIDIISQEVFI